METQEFSATVVDKLDLAKYGHYYTTKMTSSTTPFDFETYETIGEIPEKTCWFGTLIRQNVPFLGHQEYICVKCQQCKKAVPYVLRGQSGYWYLGMPRFMESYSYTCNQCQPILD